VLYAPGKAGTLQEVFQDAAQNNYRTAGGFSPMVFLDIDQSWSTNAELEQGTKKMFDVKSVLATLFNDADETFLHYVQTVDDVVHCFTLHAKDVEKWAPAVPFGH
jgi:hypothetical protein